MHNAIVIQLETRHHKTDIALIPEIDTDLKALLLLHSVTDQVMKIIYKIHCLIVHHTDLLIYRHVDEIHCLV